MKQLQKGFGTPLVFLLVTVLAVAAVVYLVQQSKKSDTNSIPVVDKNPSIIQKDRVPNQYVCVGEFCDGSGIDDNAASRTVLQIPLITDGGTVGCGVRVFFAPHWVPKTSSVLDATYRLLFNLKTTPEVPTDSFRNTVGVYTALHYESVSIVNGTAKLMLTGAMTGPGHCAEPELRAQINQAAFQFDSVQKIEVYLNGKIFDWCMTSDASPSESRCDTTPRYWIDTKK